MIVNKEHLGQLRYFYAVAVGKQSGIWGEWETARKFVEGFSKPVHKGFNNKREAVAFIIEKLTYRSETTTLTPEQLETLTSCNKLVADWRREAERESLI